jgi:hypothetical protein
VIGVLLSSLTLPHLLHYDLCVLIPAGVLFIGKNGPLRHGINFRAIGVAGWIIVSGFLPILLTHPGEKILPLILKLILLTLFVLLLVQVHRLWKSPENA